MIQAHIHKLLFDHDCVIIPDFGGLITHYEAARIHPVKHSFLPPSKRIAFNEKLKINDGLLISTYAYDRHISSEDAQLQIAGFVRQIKAELQVAQRYEWKGIGLFRLNEEQRIEFEYIANDNFLSDSFGLPELMVRPVLTPDATAGLRTLLKEKATTGPATPGKPTLRRKIRRIYDRVAVLTVSGLTVTALYFISQSVDYDVSSLNPFAINNSTVSANESIPEHSASKNRQQEEVPAFTPSGNKDVVAELSEIENILAEDKTTIPADQPTTKVTDTTAQPAKVVPSVSNSTTVATLNKEAAENIKKENKPALKEIKPPAIVKATSNSLETNTINASTGRFYVITGAYSTLKKANYYRRLHVRHGLIGKIILPFGSNKLHRVSLTDFASREEALQELPALRKKFGPDIWILNY